MNVDLAPYIVRCNHRPYDHQMVGIYKLVEHPFFALFDEMGAGKTIQTIVAAMILFSLGVIDRMLVMTPASVRGVWFDPELGELRKHLWPDLDARITEFHAKNRTWTSGEKVTSGSKRTFEVFVTNYEFIGRSRNRLTQLLPFCNSKTLLVLDESSSVKNHRAAQSKACLRLRNECGRVILLNGTPIANSPMDMFAQGNMMSPKILECKYYLHYRSRYAVMAPNANFPQIIGWQNLDDLQRRFAPYVLRRLKKDCLDLPEKLPPVTLTCTLSDETWAKYKEMRDQMVAWLSDRSVSVAGQAVVKALRLAQITSGFLGGVEEEIKDADLFNEVDQTRESFIAPFPEFPDAFIQKEYPAYTGPVQEIGREKLDMFLEWWGRRLEEDPNLKLLVFCRFRPELERLTREVTENEKLERVSVGEVRGGQKKGDREKALRLLDPRTAPEGPVLVGGTYGTGAKGLTLTACHTIVNMSYDYSLEKFLQSGDRIHRPGQISPCSFFDIVAVGPKGQKTIDHTIVRARRNKEDLAIWTQAAWLAALREE